MAPILLIAVAVLLTWTGGTSAESFELMEKIDKNNFFKKFNFLTKGRGPNPYDDNNSYVNYQDFEQAEAKNITMIQGNDIYLGVDHTTVLNHTGHPGRDTFRIESKDTYKHGLFVARFTHLPAAVCGTWPAFWTLGTGDWPVSGEIDIYEGWNLNTFNKPTIHVGTEAQIGQCTLRGTTQGAKVLAEDCDTFAPTHARGQGCQTEETTGSIWGSPKGGTQALLWTKDEIKIYTWPHGKEPANLKKGDEIDTDEWSAMTPSLHLKTCDIDRAFQNQRLMFDIAFCGRPAGSVFWEVPDHKGEETCLDTTKTSTCEAYVAKNPGAFKDVYFQIQDIRYFRLKGEAKSSSALRASKTSSSRMATKSSLSRSGTSASSTSTPSANPHKNATSSGTTHVTPPSRVGTARVGPTRKGSSSLPTLKTSAGHKSSNSSGSAKETKGSESHTSSSSASASSNATLTASTLTRVPKVTGSSSRAVSTSNLLSPGSESAGTRLGQDSASIIPSTNNSLPSKTVSALTSTMTVLKSKTRYVNRTSSSYLEPSSYSTVVLVETTVTRDAAADAAQALKTPSSDPAGRATAGDSSPEILASAGVDLRFGGPDSGPSASRSSGASVITDAPGAEEMAAVTVYRTTRSIITACPSPVTACVVGRVTVVVIPWYVTYCPMTRVQTQALETSTANPAGPKTVRVIIVKIFRIRRCPSTVPDCPLGSVGTVSATRILCDGKDCTPPGPTEPPRLDVDPGKSSGGGANVPEPDKQLGDGILPTFGPSDSDPPGVITRVTRIIRIARCPRADNGCFVGKMTTTVINCPGPECSRPTAPAQDPANPSPTADPETPLSDQGSHRKEPDHPDVEPGPLPSAPESPRSRETRVLVVTRCPSSVPGCSIGSLTTVVVEASCSGPECSVATAAPQPPNKHPNVITNRIGDPQSGRPRCPEGTPHGQKSSGKGPSPAGPKGEVPLKDSGGSTAVPGKDKETRPDGTPVNIHATAEASVKFEPGSGVPPENPGKGPRQKPDNSTVGPKAGSPPQGSPGTETPPSGRVSPVEKSKEGPNGSPSADPKPNGVAGKETPPKDSDSPGGGTSGKGASGSETPSIARGPQHAAQSGGVKPPNSSVAQLRSGATQVSAGLKLWSALVGAVVILL